MPLDNTITEIDVCMAYSAWHLTWNETHATIITHDSIHIHFTNTNDAQLICFLGNNIAVRYFCKRMNAGKETYSYGNNICSRRRPIIIVNSVL